jgi:hypothetical protein
MAIGRIPGHDAVRTVSAGGNFRERLEVKWAKRPVG